MGNEMDALLGLGLLRTLQTNDERDLELELLGGFDDTLCDVIAAHDTYTSQMDKIRRS